MAGEAPVRNREQGVRNELRRKSGDAIAITDVDGVANAADVPGHAEYKHWYTDFF